MSAQILVVEDDPTIRELLATFLTDEGYEVAVAPHGQAALDYLRQAASYPQLILLDLGMPVMNGWEFWDAHQRDPALQRIPVIALTADRTVIQRATPIPGNVLLAKPVDLDTLLEMVARYSRDAAVRNQESRGQTARSVNGQR